MSEVVDNARRHWLKSKLLKLLYGIHLDDLIEEMISDMNADPTGIGSVPRPSRDGIGRVVPGNNARINITMMDDSMLSFPLTEGYEWRILPHCLLHKKTGESSRSEIPWFNIKFYEVLVD